MLAWSVRVAQASGQFVETMVSTEDLKIAEIAQACGAKVPFLCSAKNVDHYATTVHVLYAVTHRNTNAVESCDVSREWLWL